MANAKWFVPAAVFVIALSGAALAEAQRTITFSVAGKTFSSSIPEGFCEPQGADKAIAEAFGDLDTQNFTHATFRKCGEREGDYSLIKSMRKAAPITIAKPLFIALVAKQFEGDAWQQKFGQGIETAKGDIAKGTGNQVAVKQAGAQGGGFDKDCAYIVGSVEVAAGEETQLLNFGSCLTLVGGRSFAIHSYSDAGTDVSIETLKQRSRAIAVTITELP